MILVTGASSGVGQSVADELQKRGAAFKAMYRDPKQAKPGITTVVADFSDKKSLHAAFAGIESIFVVCAPIQALVELEGNAIDAARECGVKHVVLNSALGAGDYPKSFPSWHRKVEDKLKASGLSYTILRPNSFMQNILAYMAPSIRSQGAFYSSIGKSKNSYLDVRDIASAAATALISPKDHAGKVYELNGPEALTNDEVAERISRATGKSVKYIDIPIAAQQKSMLDMGMPAWQVDALLDLQRYYIGGQGGEVTDTLANLLQRPPIKLDQFLQEFKASF